jgi:hypothetical protein
MGLVPREGGGGLRATETFGGSVVATERRAQIAISKQKPSDLFSQEHQRSEADRRKESPNLHSARDLGLSLPGAVIRAATFDVRGGTPVAWRGS